MDIPQLAQTLAAALAPNLQAFWGGGDRSRFADEILAVWDKLRLHVEQRPGARSAVEDLARRPENRAARRAFARQLEEILEADPDLAAEVARQLYLAVPCGAPDSEPRRSPRSRPEKRGRIFDAFRNFERVLGSDEEMSAPSPAPAPPYPAAAAQEPSTEARFTTYTPAAVRPETWATLLAYAHLPGAAQAVEQDRKSRLGGSPLRSEGAAGQAIVRGTEITVVPDVSGCQFNPPRASFLWLEDWHRAEFRFQAALPAGAAEARFSGWVSFYVGPVLVGETPIGFRVSPQADPAEVDRPAEPSTASPYQAIFVSYSHQDKVIVEQLERAYKALGMSYLRDVEILRSGEEWNPALLQKIDEADIFQLCWSQTASVSPYVKQEWQRALARGKPAFIRPLYWEQPMPAPPPELARLHFAFYELPR